MLREVVFVALLIALGLLATTEYVNAESGGGKMTAERPGYDDTPFIPGTNYRVHDKERPHPPVVTSPAESSQDAPGKPPSDAIVLFDGKDLSGWRTKEGDAKWKVENGYMEVVKKTGDIWTKEEFGDCQLHVEWASPAQTTGAEQGRGNSGVFLMKRYEIQILDCYDNLTYADGMTAGIYGQFPPLVNACRKPGEWQSYDIIWHGPRFEGDNLTTPATLTMFHNGVLVHDNVELVGPTTHRTTLPYKPHSEIGSLRLQDHGHPVRFRNIWYRPIAE